MEKLTHDQISFEAFLLLPYEPDNEPSDTLTNFNSKKRKREEVKDCEMDLIGTDESDIEGVTTLLKNYRIITYVNHHDTNSFERIRDGTMDYDVTSLVIDNGSFTIKSGFGADDTPRAVFPSAVGRRPPGQMVSMGGDCRSLVGDEAVSRSNTLNVFFPVERGIVNDWDVMEELWKHTFLNELRIAPEEHSVLLTEPPLNPRPNREKMVQIMFEKFEVPAVYVINPAVLALASLARHTGVVLDSGDGVTTVVPVYQGHAIEHATTRIELAGRDLTDYMMKLMNAREVSLPTGNYNGVARHIKETLCYVPLDYEQELVTATNTNTLARDYELAGVHIELNSERFRCSEAMFQPSLLGLETAGIHEHINNAIKKCEDDLHLRRELYGSIILAGGNTMFPGMIERLQKELTALAPTDKIVKVFGTPERRYSTWLGGSTVAAMMSPEKWITKREYEENGAKIVHRKCF